MLKIFLFLLNLVILNNLVAVWKCFLFAKKQSFPSFFLAELEGIFMHILSRLQFQGVQKEGESSSLIGRYLLHSSSGDQMSTAVELDTLKTLFYETLDILDTEVR